MKNSISIVSLTAIATSSLLAVDIPSSAEPGRLEKRFEKPPTPESKPTKPKEEKKLEQQRQNEASFKKSVDTFRKNTAKKAAQKISSRLGIRGNTF